MLTIFGSEFVTVFSGAIQEIRVHERGKSEKKTEVMVTGNGESRFVEFRIGNLKMVEIRSTSKNICFWSVGS